MKLFVSSLILLCLFLQTAQAQSPAEMNSGVTTELTSSSNGMLPYWHGQGWACGINGTVIRSVHTQSQWRNVSGNGIPSNVALDNICGIDSNIAFVAGHLNTNTWVWKTTNGGNNWIQVFNQPNGRINSVWMRNYLQGFIQGNPVSGRWSIWKTSNGGNNWDSTGLFLPQEGSELGWLNSFCNPLPINFPGSDSGKIWFGTNNYRIYYSSNYGQSWNAQQIPQEQNILCITYFGNLLYAGGSSNLYKTTNYGLNWVRDSVGGSGSIKGVTRAAWSFYLIRENKIYQNIFSGNWYPCFTAPAGIYNYLDNRGFGNGCDHYAVRTNGGITGLWEAEGVQKISSEIPVYYHLSQNYPNPFNPKSNIKFDIAKLGDVKLIIYDVLGREIETLVNEELQPGIYETEWDASNNPSGVYFYKLITAGYTETRKMVLVK
jgi:photosystem II stability/assembly factor-like uncharacterized protein